MSTCPNHPNGRGWQCARNHSTNEGICPEGTCDLQTGALHTRWHNHSLDELMALEAEARRHAYLIKLAVRDRLVADAGIEIGAIYRVKNDGYALAGRLMWVEGVNAGIEGTDFRGENGWTTFAWGRLNGKSAAGDGWTIKRQNVSVERLEYEGPAPS